MGNSKMIRIGGFIGSVGLTAALVGASATGTGAYFSDAKAGNPIKGTMGHIAIEGYDGTGANNLGIEFTDMLPGETQTKTVRFANTGKNKQDVWVVFDQDKLGSGDGETGLNSLGTYAEVLIKSSGTTIFHSANLNDRASTCPPGAGDPACNPLPHMLKLHEGLAPGQQGSFEFSFTPSGKFKTYQNVTILDLPYTLVATQRGITPDHVLNSTRVQ